MLFLGAGASKAVGLPTLPELTQEIRKAFDNPFEPIDKLLAEPSEINYPKNELDLEIYITIIDSLTETSQSIMELGPFAVYLYKMLENKGGLGKIMSVQEIRTLKINSLEFMDKILRKDIDIDLAKRLYDELFKIGNLISEITDASGGKTSNIFDYVVTTNYDLVLENYANETEKDYLTQRGFQKIPRGIGDYLDIVSLRSSCPNYLKLHGSLDWWKRNDGRIVISNMGGKLYGRELVEHLMIYPIYEKYISLEPFYSLYSAFRKRLWEELIVVIIGYSFRDISVNNAFADFLRFNKNARIIISTKSKSVKDRINKTFSFTRNRVQIIETYFGEKDFPTDLRNALTTDCRLNSGSVNDRLWHD